MPLVDAVMLVLGVLAILGLWQWVASRPLPGDSQTVELEQRIAAVFYLMIGVTGSLTVWLAGLTYFLLMRGA